MSNFLIYYLISIIASSTFYYNMILCVWTKYVVVYGWYQFDVTRQMVESKFTIAVYVYVFLIGTDERNNYTFNMMCIVQNIMVVIVLYFDVLLVVQKSLAFLWITLFVWFLLFCFSLLDIHHIKVINKLKINHFIVVTWKYQNGVAGTLWTLESPALHWIYGQWKFLSLKIWRKKKHQNHLKYETETHAK